MFKRILDKKIKASRQTEKQFHDLLISVAPLSLRYIKQPKINNQILDKFLKIFKSKSAQELYNLMPQDADGSSLFYLEYSDLYFLSTMDVKTMFFNLSKRSHQFQATKRAEKQLKSLVHKNCKYVHFEERGAKLASKTHDELDVELYSQFNIPSKKVILKMIRRAMQDASMVTINRVDEMAIQSKKHAYEQDYHQALNSAEQYKNTLKDYKQHLKYIHNFLKKHKEDEHHD